MHISDFQNRAKRPLLGEGNPCGNGIEDLGSSPGQLRLTRGDW